MFEQHTAYNTHPKVVGVSAKVLEIYTNYSAVFNFWKVEPQYFSLDPLSFLDVPKYAVKVLRLDLFS